MSITVGAAKCHVLVPYIVERLPCKKVRTCCDKVDSGPWNLDALCLGPEHLPPGVHLAGDAVVPDEDHLLVVASPIIGKYSNNFSRCIVKLVFKGAVSRDFLAIFYFMNRSHLGP